MQGRCAMKGQVGWFHMSNASLSGITFHDYQGYIWMAHRSPVTASWKLAGRSVALWKELVAQDPDLRSAVEWQDTGSLLLAESPAEASQLRDRQALLQQHGVASRLLDCQEVLRMEPSLAAHSQCGGLVTEGDAQIVSIKIISLQEISPTAPFKLSNCITTCTEWSTGSACHPEAVPSLSRVHPFI